MIIDLGCGSWCRGDIGIDKQFNYPPVTKHLDDIIGLSKNEKAEFITADLNQSIPLNGSSQDATFLLIHVLESLDSPLNILREIAKFKPKKVIIVVPNAQQNLADWYDETHIYSFTEASIRQLVSKVFSIKAVRLIVRNQDIAIVAAL